jgi:hypothetical protein
LDVRIGSGGGRLLPADVPHPRDYAFSRRSPGLPQPSTKVRDILVPTMWLHGSLDSKHTHGQVIAAFKSINRVLCTSTKVNKHAKRLLTHDNSECKYERYIYIDFGSLSGAASTISITN